jgi:hypothetical protein
MKISGLGCCFFLIMLCAGCKSQNSESIKEEHTAASFKKNMAKHFHDSSLQKLKRDIEGKLGLESIENGSEGVEIRIWRGYGALVNKEDLLAIRNTDSGWRSVYFTYKFAINDTADATSIDHIQATKKTPVSGWTKLWQNIVNLGVLELPSYELLKNYSISTDADGATIEYADRNNYRIFVYPDPYNNKKIPEANKITELLLLLEKEFEIQDFAGK